MSHRSILADDRLLEFLGHKEEKLKESPHCFLEGQAPLGPHLGAPSEAFPTAGITARHLPAP